MDGVRTDAQPWERQRGESAKAYEAFRTFRDVGPHRSLLGCRSIERRWSYRWRWADRAAAWDVELYRVKDAALLAAVAPAVALGEPVDDGWNQLAREFAGR